MHCSPTFCRLRAKGSGHFCKPAQLQPWIAGHTLRSMTLNFRGQVHSGRLIVNEPIDLPDGSEVALSVVEAGDELDDEAKQLAIDRMPARLKGLLLGLVADRKTKFESIPFLVNLRIEGSSLEEARLVAEARMPLPGNTTPRPRC